MFNVGDIVTGIHAVDGSVNPYNHTGLGSTCKVVEILTPSQMVVELIAASPQVPFNGERSFVIQTKFFKKVYERVAQAEEVKMKVETMKVFYCQQSMQSTGICGEIAEHRISIPGLAVTLCRIHAKPYVNGQEQLKAVKCKWDQEICKPGYTRNEDYGYTFCSDECESAYLAHIHRSASSPSYA